MSAFYTPGLIPKDYKRDDELEEGDYVVHLQHGIGRYRGLKFLTRGDEGIVIKDDQRTFSLFGSTVNLADPILRYNIALAFLAVAIVLCLIVVRSKIGHVLVAIRENENRTAMLGYDVKRYKLIAFVLSGSFAAFSGAAYALLFAYAGSTLASIQYSINPLLWTLLGGAATVLGPVLGTALMFLLVDFASGFTSASLFWTTLLLGASLAASSYPATACWRSPLAS